MRLAAVTCSASRGMKSGDQPCIRCGRERGWLPLRIRRRCRACAMPLASMAELSGSQTMICVCGLFSFSTRDTPFSVPPVPKPVTQ